MIATVAAAAAMSGPSSTRSLRRPLSIDFAENSRPAATRSSAPTQMSGRVAPLASRAARASDTAPRPVPTVSGRLTSRRATWNTAA